MRRSTLFKFMAVTMTAALVGCVPGGGATGATPSKVAASKDLGTAQIKLKLVATPESGALAKAAIPGFEKKFPNVKIEYSETSYEDYNKNLNLDLDSANPPDVVLLNSVGNTVKNGLVRDLDEYVQLYDWARVYPQTQLAQWRVGADGTTLGDGGLYAAPAGFSVVGVYYNKEQAAKIGMTTPPTDLEGFESAMRKAREAGLLPLQLGNAEGHAAFPVQLVGQSMDTVQKYSPWLFGHSGATFDSEGNRAGLQKLIDWKNAGYIPDNSNGVSLQDAVDAFGKGEGLFFIDGNWDAGKIDKAMGSNVGFFTFPGKSVTGIGTSVAYGIASKSPNQNAAAAFLDYLTTSDAGVFQFESGFIPVNADKITPTGVRSEIIKAFGQVREANGLAGFAANSSPTMSKTLSVVTQELIGGKANVDDAVKRVQADWSQAHGK